MIKVRLIMVLDEKLELITIHPEGNMNVCTTFNGNPSSDLCRVKKKKCLNNFCFLISLWENLPTVTVQGQSGLGR